MLQLNRKVVKMLKKKTQQHKDLGSKGTQDES